MTYGFEPNLSFLNQQVPLWFALLCAFTSPYLWARYAKDTVRKLLEKTFGITVDNNEKP
jgi:hypothetical protein